MNEDGLGGGGKTSDLSVRQYVTLIRQLSMEHQADIAAMLVEKMSPKEVTEFLNMLPPVFRALVEAKLE